MRWEVLELVPFYQQVYHKALCVANPCQETLNAAM